MLLARIRRVRVFDPVCGSGNFLVIAYKELCKLEMEVFELLRLIDQQFKLLFSEVQFENFTGIDTEFAVETAKLSLYIAQHQMNGLFEERFAIADGESKTALARELGLTRDTVYRYMRRAMSSKAAGKKDQQ